MPPKTPNTAISTVYRSCTGSRCLWRQNLTPRVDRARPISTYGYTQAKALVYSGHGIPNDVLDLHTHSLPPPHSSLITLRTLAAPLNPSDINVIQGTYPLLPPLTTHLGTPSPSAVPGSEGCFQVLSAGSAVTALKPGDWVTALRPGLGTWRTHLQVPESSVTKVTNKEGLTPQQVGSVSVNPVTAYRLLRGFMSLREGEWWVQNGANSGVGRAALQLGKRWGYKSIAIVRSRPGEAGAALKREMLDLGATEVVSDDQVASREFRDQMSEWTHGGREPIRLALNCVGGTPAMQMAKLLSPGGCMVTYGAMSKQPMRVGASMLIFNDIRFEGFWVSRWSDAHGEEKRRTVEELLEMMRKGEFVDAPVVEVGWDWDTRKEVLVDAVGGTLSGYRKGKGVFVFGDT